IDSGRLVCCLALEARVEPFGVIQHPHQRAVLSLRALSRPLCETNKVSCHEHSPLGVGSCFPYPLSQTDAPLLPPHYQSSSLVWAPPTSDHHRLLPRCLGLSEGAPYYRRRRSDLLGYHALAL